MRPMCPIFLASALERPSVPDDVPVVHAGRRVLAVVPPTPEKTRLYTRRNRPGDHLTGCRHAPRASPGGTGGGSLAVGGSLPRPVQFCRGWLARGARGLSHSPVRLSRDVRVLGAYDSHQDAWQYHLLRATSLA